MEHLNKTTSNLTHENVERLIRLFPSIATEVINAEGNTQKAVDFDALRELLGDVAEGQRERYQFTWPGKREAKSLARTPCDKTMRPERGRSVNWDTTENLYIEGDNLEALKLMRETYAGKIKLIYIDPPYNTGHDFIYDDNFAQTREEYDAGSGDYDDQGGRLVANLEGNGRFHSDWCSMLLPRLLLSRDLLTSDGIIFISIDVHEFANLKKICDEVFGAINLRNVIAVRRGIKNVQAQFADIQSLSQGHEYILMYSKVATARLPKLSLAHGGKPGKWDTFWRGTDRPTMRYELFGQKPDKGQWRWAKDRTDEAKRNYELFLQQEEGGLTLDEYFTEHYMATNEKLNFVRLNEDGVVQYYVPPSEGKLLSDNWMDLTLAGNETEFFDTEKNVLLLERMISWLTSDNDIILDFFSGSATTAHAVMNVNQRDSHKRRFIMVQLPESCDNVPAAVQAGYATICDIGENRIREAGHQIDGQNNDSQLTLDGSASCRTDVGFRVLRIDSSNFRDTHSEPGNQNQATLYDFIDNLKDDRTPEDLLFQVLPSFRIPYSARIEEYEIDGVKCFNVNDGQLVACFDTEVGTSVIEKIAQGRPIYAVFRDASLADDSAAANFEELFKTYSPDTIRRVI